LAGNDGLTTKTSGVRAALATGVVYLGCGHR
jgi:hypothetical protein